MLEASTHTHTHTHTLHYLQHTSTSPFLFLFYFYLIFFLEKYLHIPILHLPMTTWNLALWKSLNLNIFNIDTSSCTTTVYISQALSSNWVAGVFSVSAISLYFVHVHNIKHAPDGLAGWLAGRPATGWLGIYPSAILMIRYINFSRGLHNFF